MCKSQRNKRAHVGITECVINSRVARDFFESCAAIRGPPPLTPKRPEAIRVGQAGRVGRQNLILFRRAIDQH
ncbi:MAG: hypothetical protein MnENMB40S_14650 [Rhizobiaceae bacterium MnEN-MB40S]|nr:MAG: hypothetical protein MnENMB40S_14650 [Rhizobiaceae bacterium MnEN-MB40S]